MNIVQEHIQGFKFWMADVLGLYEEPVYLCPIKGCNETGNFGREIWHHLVRKHPDEVMAHGE